MKQDHPKGMKLTSIRVSVELWEAVQEEAKRHGISAAEYIREAVWLRLGFQFAERIAEDPVIERLRRIDQRIAQRIGQKIDERREEEGRGPDRGAPTATVDPVPAVADEPPASEETSDPLVDEDVLRATRAYLVANPGWHPARVIWRRPWPGGLAPTFGLVDRALRRLIAEGEVERDRIEGEPQYRLRRD